MSDKPDIEEMLFQSERSARHMDAARDSDMQFLRDQLRSAASRFEDLAKIIEEKGDYDPVPFIRASAKRFRRASEV